MEATVVVPPAATGVGWYVLYVILFIFFIFILIVLIFNVVYWNNVWQILNTLPNNKIVSVGTNGNASATTTFTLSQANTAYWLNLVALILIVLFFILALIYAVYSYTVRPVPRVVAAPPVVAAPAAPAAVTTEVTTTKQTAAPVVATSPAITTTSVTTPVTAVSTSAVPGGLVAGGVPITAAPVAAAPVAAVATPAIPPGYYGVPQRNYYPPQNYPYYYNGPSAVPQYNY